MTSVTVRVLYLVKVSVSVSVFVLYRMTVLVLLSRASSGEVEARVHSAMAEAMVDTFILKQ